MSVVQRQGAPGEDAGALGVGAELLEGDLLSLREAQLLQHVGCLGRHIHRPRRLHAQAHHVAQLCKCARCLLYQSDPALQRSVAEECWYGYTSSTSASEDVGGGECTLQKEAT